MAPPNALQMLASSAVLATAQYMGMKERSAGLPTLSTQGRSSCGWADSEIPSSIMRLKRDYGYVLLKY